MSITVKKYRFRAECEPDVMLFLYAIRGWALRYFAIEDDIYTGDDGRIYQNSDREVTMDVMCNLSLANLRWIANQITDCHVIAETLQSAESYTGDRTYGKRQASKAPCGKYRRRIIEGILEYKEFLENNIERALSAIEAVNAIDEIELMQRRFKVKAVPATQPKQIRASRQAS